MTSIIIIVKLLLCEGGGALSKNIPMDNLIKSSVYTLNAGFVEEGYDYLAGNRAVYSSRGAAASGGLWRQDAISDRLSVSGQSD